ncbi:MAG: hypothetical protein V8R52_04400 [Coprobacter fastidiosus]
MEQIDSGMAVTGGNMLFGIGSLGYSGRYEPLTAVEIADRMEEMIRLTGERAFIL